VKQAQQDRRLTELMRKDPNFSTSLRQLPRTRTQDLARLVIPDASNFMDDAFETLYSSGISPEQFLSRLAHKMRKKADLLAENFHAHYG
jgi:sn-glycerol 3-phosphate transport system substrate-binding protein